jgi:hypothetical protein
MSVRIPDQTFNFWLAEIDECHRLLDHTGAPRDLEDGSRLSLSQRLRLAMEAPSGNEEEGSAPPIDTAH